MKRFYLNAAAFLIIFVIVLGGFEYLSICDSTRGLIAAWTDSTDYLNYSGSAEIKPYIQKVQTADGTTKLILGDSVCHQMFSGLQDYNHDFTIAGSNGAITMAGQYILAKEYLEAHPDATDIFLLALPESLGRTFDTTWGYQYTIMPFSETDTLDHLDQDTIDIMEDTYGKPFLIPEIVTLIDLSAVNQKLYLNFLRDHASGYTLKNHFELADQYITKIYNMCKDRDVSFHLYPCPVSEDKADEVISLTEAFESSAIYNINPEFLHMVCYYPAEQAADGIHFSGDYKNQPHFNETITRMLAGKELLDMLKFQ